MMHVEVRHLWLQSEVASQRVQLSEKGSGRQEPSGLADQILEQIGHRASVEQDVSRMDRPTS
jgi:hypothetical protein